eukprot:121502_1
MKIMVYFMADILLKQKKNKKEINTFFILSFSDCQSKCKDIEHKKKDVYKNEEKNSIWARRNKKGAIFLRKKGPIFFDAFAFICGTTNEILFIASENSIKKYDYSQLPRFATCEQGLQLVVGCQICAE